MIPKVIHYCWFGCKPIPEKYKKYISSWKVYCPDYEIKLWNEENFDLKICPYVYEAADAKKWAFVSDYARFWILYHFGGIYFDTDVELIKPIAFIVNRGAFMGIEYSGGIAPGLGIGAEPGMEFYKEILDFYSTLHFKNPDGSLNEQTIVKYTTDMFKKYGWKYDIGQEDYSTQCIRNIWIYPIDVFCPMNYETGKTIITDNTLSIHHYEASWHSWIENLIVKIERCEPKKRVEYNIRRFVSLPFRIVNKLNKIGIKKTIRLSLRKISIFKYDENN